MNIGNETTYKLVRSNRRTLSLQVDTDGSVTVRAPYLATKREINEFIAAHKDWIDKQLDKQAHAEEQAAKSGTLSLEDLQELANKALREIPPRVKYWAGVMGVTYGRITIRNQKTRWGSCSSKGNLNFNCLLMLAPQEVIDSVIVHELCHRKHMDHSPAFYADILKFYPEYKKWNGWLKKNGAVLMKRMTG